MITTANKGKTLIYIYYNTETKPEIFPVSQARDEFAKVMFLEGKVGEGCRGEGCGEGGESFRSPGSPCIPPTHLEGQRTASGRGETGLTVPVLS